MDDSVAGIGHDCAMKPFYRVIAVLLSVALPLQGLAAHVLVASMVSSGCAMMMPLAFSTASAAVAPAVVASDDMSASAHQHHGERGAGDVRRWRAGHDSAS